MKLTKVIFAIVCLLGASHAGAAVVTFDATDPGVGPADPRPNSDAEAALFDAAAGALGTITTLDLEAVPLGDFASQSLGSGVTATLTGTDSSGGILDDPGFVPIAWGYNTTSGGSRFLRVVHSFGDAPCSVSFAFSAPIQAFGFYITGLGTDSGELSALFDDGSAMSLSIVGDPTGGAKFFGFTDAGKSISSVTLELTGVAGIGDYFSVDDLRFTPTDAPVPEPGSLALGAVGLLLLPFVRGAKRRQRSSSVA